MRRRNIRAARCPLPLPRQRPNRSTGALLIGQCPASYASPGPNRVSFRFPWPNSHTPWFSGNNRAVQQFICVRCHCRYANLGVTTRAKIYKSYDSAMRQAATDCPLSEIFVDRNQNSRFTIRLRQNDVVARILRPVPDPNDVVPRITQLSSRLTPNTGIQKQLHSVTPALISSGSIRSLPM
jgi:hypothetical protein